VTDYYMLEDEYISDRLLYVKRGIHIILSYSV